MRAILGVHARSIRWSSLPASALVGTLGLFVAACHADGPTAVGGGDAANLPAASFPLATGAAHAATTSTNRLVRTLPTVQLMSASQGRVAASGGLTNSPFDLTYLGGPVVTSATSRNVYINCPSNAAGCWGTGVLSPATLLRDLNRSNLIGVADQYLDENAAGQFTVTELQTTATFTGNTATLDDIFGILFSASTFINASGYNNLFHVFLPQGTDMCISATECYSPDNPSTFVFCAFHGSVDFGPNQHVVFSVEPYQAVNGCTLPTQTRVIDATASSLSHEFFESITDPDLDAWFNLLTGNEIGDLCFGFRNPVRLGYHSYVVQEEYSNSDHACTYGA